MSKDHTALIQRLRECAKFFASDYGYPQADACERAAEALEGAERAHDDLFQKAMGIEGERCLAEDRAEHAEAALAEAREVVRRVNLAATATGLSPIGLTNALDAVRELSADWLSANGGSDDN